MNVKPINNKLRAGRGWTDAASESRAKLVWAMPSREEENEVKPLLLAIALPWWRCKAFFGFAQEQATESHSFGKINLMVLKHTPRGNWSFLRRNRCSSRIGVANNAHSRCRLSIAQASLALRSAQAFFSWRWRTPSPRDSESKLSLSSRLRRSLTCCYKTKEEKDWMLSCLKSTGYLFVCKTAVYFWQFLHKIAVLFWQID